MISNSNVEKKCVHKEAGAGARSRRGYWLQDELARGSRHHLELPAVWTRPRFVPSENVVGRRTPSSAPNIPSEHSLLSSDEIASRHRLDEEHPNKTHKSSDFEAHQHRPLMCCMHGKWNNHDCWYKQNEVIISYDEISSISNWSLEKVLRNSRNSKVSRWMDSS